jgi:hypothetical protein
MKIVHEQISCILNIIYTQRSLCLCNLVNNITVHALQSNLRRLVLKIDNLNGMFLLNSLPYSLYLYFFTFLYNIF